MALPDNLDQDKLAEAVRLQLNGHGIAITEEVEFEGAMFFFVRDPDGNVIEFHKPAD